MKKLSNREGIDIVISKPDKEVLIPDEVSNSLEERWNRIRIRRRIEKTSGIAAQENPSAFLEYCQKHEHLFFVVPPSDDRPQEPTNGSDKWWRHFDKWNDSPIFAIFRKRTSEEKVA